MDSLLADLAICKPTKISDNCFFVPLSTGFQLEITHAEGACEIQVYKGSDTDGWYPYNEPKQVCNTKTVSHINAVVFGWQFLYGSTD